MYEIFVRLLQERGVSTYRVAKETGISNATFSDWKTGRSTPKADKLQKIADYFAVPMAYLMGTADQRDAQPQRKVSDEDIKFALFHGAEDITDEMYEEVKRYARYVKDRERHDDKGTV